MKTVGVLALQGDFAQHVHSLEQQGVEVVLVKLPTDLKDLDGLIIPGGESTTIAKLLKSTKLDEAIKSRIKTGMAVWGTCAGAILMAKTVHSKVPLDAQLGVMDVEIERNAYGRQKDSFLTQLKLNGNSFEAFFIRAPRVLTCGRWEKVLLEHKGDPVMVQRKKLLLTTFHSELSENDPVLSYFLGLL